jgi:hypothetical protein
MTKARRPASREEIGALSGATRTTDAGFTPELTLGEGFAGPGFGRLCLCRCSNAFRCAGLEARWAAGFGVEVRFGADVRVGTGAGARETCAGV